MIKSIRKRDGRLVDFEVDKIAGALYKAFSACFDKVELKKVYAIAHDVEKRLEEKESTLPTVELVQDTVEEILIEEGYVRVFKLLKELNIDEEIIYQKVSETFAMTDETLKSVIK